MYIIVVCHNNVVDDLYEIQEKDRAEEAFLEECRVINDYVEVDRETVLDDGYFTNGEYGVSFWSV